MSDHVKVLERFILERKCGFVVASIRALLEKNERLRTSLVEHFQREHIDGDGPEIDRWKARIDGALALHSYCEKTETCLECQYDWDGYCQSPTVKALRGEE